MQCLQSLLVVLLHILQLLQSVFLQLQGLHVNLLAFHLREELIHSLRETTASDFRKGIPRVNINLQIIHIRQPCTLSKVSNSKYGLFACWAKRNGWNSSYL